MARDDDRSAMAAVEAVRAQRGRMATDVLFAGHGALAHVASRIGELNAWAAGFRRRYMDE